MIVDNFSSAPPSSYPSIGLCLHSYLRKHSLLSSVNSRTATFKTFIKIYEAVSLPDDLRVILRVPGVCDGSYILTIWRRSAQDVLILLPVIFCLSVLVLLKLSYLLSELRVLRLQILVCSLHTEFIYHHLNLRSCLR